MKSRILAILSFIFLIILVSNQNIKFIEPRKQEVTAIKSVDLVKSITLTSDAIKYDERIGFERSLQVNFELPIVSDIAINRYLDSLAQEIKNSTKSDFNFQVKVINYGDLINAFTFPAGYCYVYRGLIETTANEDELFGMLAHEWGHAISRDNSSNNSIVRDIEVSADHISLKILKHNNRNTHATFSLLNRIDAIANINIGGTNPKPNLRQRLESIKNIIQDTSPKLNLLPEYEYWTMRSRLAHLKSEERFIVSPSYLTIDLSDHQDVRVRNIMQKKKKLNRKR